MITSVLKKKMMASIRINCSCHHHARLLGRAMLGERMAANGDWMGCSSRVIWARLDRQLNMELGIWNVQIEWRGMSDRMAHHFRWHGLTILQLYSVIALSGYQLVSRKKFPQKNIYLGTRIDFFSFFFSELGESPRCLFSLNLFFTSFIYRFQEKNT